MLISLFFSANIYRVSVQEINRSFIRQTETLQQIPRFRSIVNDPDFIKLRVDRLREAKAKIILQLALTNAVILVSGGLLSYWFAKRTLRPIQESHEAQRRFTADASHELRTPISVMRSEIEVAAKDKNLTVDDAKKVFTSNIEEIDRLTLLINNLMQLARLEDETIEVQATKVQDMLSEVDKNMTKLAAAKDINLKCQKTDIKAICNLEYTIQAVSIIVENAIKYSPNKSTVKVYTSHEGNLTNIDIEDEGPGINKKDYDKIFSRFYRADTSRTKQKVEGQGLGLSIAKGIIDKQNGKIEIHKTSPVGTIFRISLPSI